MSTQEADAICVQEIKAQDRDLDDAIRNPGGYRGYFHCADRPGYSGVGIYCRKKPDRVIEGLGIPDIDAEGRH
ncbi:MAG: endonuclease/exonuclease/phosphatase family protein, partial [Burkholderiales bacterium]